MHTVERCFGTQLLLFGPATAALYNGGGCCPRGSLNLGVPPLSSSLHGEEARAQAEGLPRPWGSQKAVFLPLTLHKLLVVQGTWGMAGKRSYAQGQELSSLLPKAHACPTIPTKPLISHPRGLPTALPHQHLIGITKPRPACAR